jgi:hypothetical protein
MNSKYDLFVLRDHMTVCNSKFEAVALAAIDGCHENDLLNLTDKDLSERTLGLILPWEVGKYLGMLLKKQYISVRICFENEKSSRLFLDVQTMREDSLDIQGVMINYTSESTSYTPKPNDSGLTGFSIKIDGENHSVIAREIKLNSIVVQSELEIRAKRSALNAEVLELRRQVKDLRGAK